MLAIQHYRLWSAAQEYHPWDDVGMPRIVEDRSGEGDTYRAMITIGRTDLCFSERSDRSKVETEVSRFTEFALRYRGEPNATSGNAD